MPLWLLVPGVALTLAVHFVAPAAGAWYAFTEWSGYGSAKFIGLDNFREAFQDPLTRGALSHTVVLACAMVVLTNLVGLGLALGLNRGLKTRLLLRSLVFLPIVISPVAVAYIWSFIFAYDGVLNTFLGAIGLSGWERPWLGDSRWALWTILVALVWQYSGLTMVIYLAGLQGIPDELMEASAVDGATATMRFRCITFPLLAPALTVSVTLTLIFGLRVFDQVLALTAGGPVGATETLATQVWQQTFVNSRFGYGSALALILTGLITLLCLAQLVVLRAREKRM